MKVRANLQDKLENVSILILGIHTCVLALSYSTSSLYLCKL